MWYPFTEFNLFLNKHISFQYFGLDEFHQRKLRKSQQPALVFLKKS
jgi:hypothetical protein